MDLSKILSIAGKPGLFKMVGESKNGIVVESLTDGKRIPAFSHERISSLQEISIYTEGEDMPLADILKNIYEKQDAKPVKSPKKLSSNDLKSLFAEVVPDYDKDAVYTSDMKKVFSWYNQLLEKDMLDFTEEEVEEEVEVEEEKEVEVEKEASSSAKATADREEKAEVEVEKETKDKKEKE